MPRFYFDLRRENVVDPDREGLLLPNANIARAQAARAAIDMVREAAPPDTAELAIAVRDEQGKYLFEVQALARVQEHQPLLCSRGRGWVRLPNPSLRTRSGQPGRRSRASVRS
jgi:hypothetical protein